MNTHISIEKVSLVRNSKSNQQSENIDNKVGIKSIARNKALSYSDWRAIKKVVWNSPETQIQTSQNHLLFINDNITLNIPTSIRELENVFTEGKYILNLKDDWDDDGSVGYTQESWEAASHFIINFNKWVKGIFSGSLYLPKMSHGPKGTIDIIWQEDNFRLFVNVDFVNNKGTFYSDTPKKQFSEGEFQLDEIKFELLPIPLKL